MASSDRARGTRDPADKPLDRLGLIYALLIGAMLAAHALAGVMGAGVASPPYERSSPR